MYCIVEDNSEHLRDNQQISIDELLESSCQIGKYMNLSYSSLIEILQQLENEGRISLINNFGNRYIQLAKQDTRELLESYYQSALR